MNITTCVSSFKGNKRHWFLLMFNCFVISSVFAQNVGVNKTGVTPNTSAILDLNTGNAFGVGTSKGLLVPNVALTGPNDGNTISNPAPSLLVYVPLGSTLTPPGYYYNSGSSTVPMWSQLGGGSWLLTGNGGTTPGTNFVGTTDATDLVFKTHGVEDMRIANTIGNVGIGTPAPDSHAELDVTSTTLGMLIPRSTTNPAGAPPPTSLLYYNSSTNCFMFYNGGNWQNISCACTGVPATPGITGNATFCPTSTSTYSVTAPATGVMYYTWTVPTGTVINTGQGTQAINVTYGTNPGTITCIATNSCGNSSPGNLTISELGSVPITITNNQGTPTPTNLAVKIIIDFTNPAYATASPALLANLTNVEFTTGPEGGGTQLNSWIESGFAPTAGTSAETAPTSSSTSAVVWVNLGTNIVTNGTPLVIYMDFTAAPVMSSSASASGMAPQWTGGYAQYDNGALVFPEFYDNFAGVGALSANWAWAGAGVLGQTTNNGLDLTMVAGKNWYGLYEKTFSAALNNVAETYCEVGSTTSQGICINTSGTNGNAINNGTDGVDAQLDGPTTQYMFGNGGSCTSAPSGNATFANATPVANTLYVFSFYMLSTPIMQLSYGAFNTLYGTGAAIGGISATSEVGLGLSGPGGMTGFCQWFRIRPSPPNAVAPTASVGTYGCY